MADIAKMIEEIKGMTVLELNDLVKAIETEFGVSAAAMAVGGPPAVSFTKLRAPETREGLVCRLLLVKKKNKSPRNT